MMRTLATLVAAFACLLAMPAVRAQEAEAEPIETDRDSFTPATTTADARRLILESGYSFIDNKGRPRDAQLSRGKIVPLCDVPR